MIAMHCPSCGAEGRIPNDKVNVRLLCKRCLESFHLTPAGKIVAGAPPANGSPVRHDHRVDDLDAVDHEIEVVVSKLKSAVPRAAAVGGLALVLVLAWWAMRGGKVLGLDDQTVLVARALARNDVAELNSLAVDGTGDEAEELAEALASELRDLAEVFRAATPSVEVARDAEPPGPGLASIVAIIRADQPVARTGMAVPDITLNMSPASIVVPLVLAGDDHAGWRLDGGRTLEAYRKARTPIAAGRAAMPAKAATRSASAGAGSM
jgi:hypothetical protein